MGAQISVWDPVFNYFGYIPRCGIADSYGNLFFRNYCNVFSTEAILFYIATNSAKGVPFSSHPYQNLLLSDLMTVAILMGMQWYLILSHA